MNYALTRLTVASSAADVKTNGHRILGGDSSRQPAAGANVGRSGGWLRAPPGCTAPSANKYSSAELILFMELSLSHTRTHTVSRREGRLSSAAKMSGRDSSSPSWFSGLTGQKWKEKTKSNQCNNTQHTNRLQYKVTLELENQPPSIKATLLIPHWGYLHVANNKKGGEAPTTALCITAPSGKKLQ